MKTHLMWSPTKGFTERVVVSARLVKRGVCSCGFPTVADHVPTGKVYDAVPDSPESMTFVCGGCKQEITVPSILVRDSTDTCAFKRLPVGLFELES
jgi:hypothetical protein